MKWGWVREEENTCHAKGHNIWTSVSGRSQVG